MASMQLTEEQLQQSAVLSDDHADFEDDLTTAAEETAKSTESPSTNQNTYDEYLSDALGNDKENRDASDAEGDMDIDDPSDQASQLSEEESLGDDMRHKFDDELLDICVEQRNAEEVSRGTRSRSSSLLVDIDEDEAEGVGAVKIRPGETDDEGEENDSDHSDSDFGNESDGAAAWEEAAENDDDEDGSEDGAPNACIFCKQDEENDPGDEFEEYLTCVGCGENSHQHCAREAIALNDSSSISNLPFLDLSQWECPECHSTDYSPVEKPLEEFQEQDEPGLQPGNGVDLSPSSRKSTASQVARDLLPPQKGAIKPDSHSVFNQLVLDGDPMDGSRILRKRKTSSVEAEDIVMSLRKRRRNTSKDRDSNHGAGTLQEVPSGTRGIDLRRKLRLNPTRKTQAVAIIRHHRSTMVKIRVKPAALRRLLSRKPSSNRKRMDRGNTVAEPRGGITTTLSASFASSDHSHPFYSFYDKEMDEMKTKPYGGILSETEADTSRTLPTNDDRRRFDEAKQKAEEVWRARLQSTQLSLGTPAKKSRKNVGPASQIECIDFGGWEIDTWYAAPYPEEYSRNRTLYICEFCLKYMNSDYVAWRHKLKCPAKHPPGDEIYRHGSVSVFEVDGRKNPVYCQNLCLLAKLFLGSKTLYYDVEPFLFYVLCEYDALGYHFVGYFSKEKRASSQNNVSCILTLPIHQRKGYGNLLIDFSYLLTRVERKTGSPEKPLSDMGLVSYRNYWRLVLCRYLSDHVSEGKTCPTGLSIRRISDDTGLTPDDVISALEGLRCLVRDPHSELYAFRVDLTYCNEYISKWEEKKYVKLNPDALTWTPYVMGRGNATNFELGPAISAIAPREEEESHTAAKERIPPATIHEESVSTGMVASEMTDKPVVSEGASLIHADAASEGLNRSRAQPDVYESTESHEDGLVNGCSGQEAEHSEEVSPADQATRRTPVHMIGDDWSLSYKDVPPSRFEVYPPLGGRRSDRSRSSGPRPAVARSSSNGSRPRRPVGGSTRRPTASRPKSSSSSSRRKSGGTGRGPGRWPKGTKKSDYGNAESGPGLPPAWIKERARLAAMVVTKDTGEDALGLDSKDTIDVVRVPVPERGKATGVFSDSEGIGNEHAGQGDIRGVQEAE
ncbi:MOZ/SAS family protein [Colletotrichum sojae]|uniref:Histone acetyltransferase n=1 Tax=Colletotrichum sojae TaxID=2175907 RepID=A0A8H6IT18_9PEZI|nr:MOZ/SAS family protein [Colletotrichum sojae]